MTSEHPLQAVAELMRSLRWDPLAYVRTMFPWGEGQLSNSQGPRVWQTEVMQAIGKHLQDPATRYQPLLIAIASGHGIGKAQPLSLMIDTPDGQRAWGDIEPGDRLFGRNGLVKVIERHDRGILPVYQVTLDDGSSTLCCADHIWTVRGRQQRRNGKNNFLQMTTAEIIKKGVKRSNGVMQAAQWELPNIKAVEYDKKELLCTPYTLGVWLGDGVRKKGYIYSNDIDVINNIEKIGERVRKTSSPFEYIVDGLPRKLRMLGILDNYSYEKSIPDCFKYAHVEDRAELLRGLMDTDGEVTKTCGTAVFSSTSKKLAEDVIWLARSLGGKAQMHPTTKMPFFPDRMGNKKAGLPCHRLSIKMPSGFQLFYINRKQERISENCQQRYLSRWIVDIKEVGSEEVMCVKVDAPDSLYLTNDFIPTHNTAGISMILNWAENTCTDCKVVVTANTEKQLLTKTWPEVSKWFSLCRFQGLFRTTATAVISTQADHELNWRADAIPWSENNTEAFAGLHNEGKRIVLIFDESSSISDLVWEVAEGAMTDANTEIIWLAFGNPTRNTGRFRECFGRFKHRWLHWQIDSRNVEGTNKEQIQKWIEDYGEDSDFVRVRVKGEFPRAGSMQFIAGDVVEASRKRESSSTLLDPCIMGVDVARFGDDQTVIVIRRGRDASSVPWITMRGADTMQVAAKVMELQMHYKCDAIFVDGGGVGGGVIDRLRMLKHPVIEVQFGGSADRAISTGEGDVAYLNKRAEMWGYMRDWLKGGSIPDDVELDADLTGVEYGYKYQSGKDCIVLESKADMKRRGLSSPDLADALALTFAYPVAPTDHTAQIENAGRTHHQINYDPLSRVHVSAVGGGHQVDYDPMGRNK